MIVLLSSVTTIPTPTPQPEDFFQWMYERGKYSDGSNSNGWVEDSLDRAQLWLGGRSDQFFTWLGQEIEHGFLWLLDKLLDVLEPFMNWGSKLAIVACFLMWFLSGDRRTISTAFKVGIIYLLFCLLRGAVNL